MTERSMPFDVGAAERHLRRVDPVLERVMRRCERFPRTIPRATSLFHTLGRAIVYQQLSGKAAATIHARFLALYRPKRLPTPADVLATPHARLRSAGLSEAKARALVDLAAKTIDGTVPTMRRARGMADAELVERLTLVRGIGTWTVEMLLLFRLGRPDVFPVTDLGVRKGYALAHGLEELPAPKALEALGEPWRPYRSVASWYLWRVCDG